MKTVLDPVTDNLLRNWEGAGFIYAIAAKEVRAELEQEVRDEQRKTA